MKQLNRVYVLGLGLVLIAAIFGPPLLAHAQNPLTTAFTYQGRLLRGSDYVDNTSCNFRFGLFNALTGGTSLGLQVINNVPVSDGYFTVNLDFGNQFNGDLRYLETEVQCPGDAGFVRLNPRVILYAAPYAQYAARVPWAGINNMPPGFADGADDGQAYTPGIGIAIGSSNVISVTFGGNGSASMVARSDHNHDTIYLNASEAAAGDLTGTYPNPTVDGLQGRPLAAVAPTAGQVLKWNGSTWVPAADDSSVYTAGTGLSLSGAQFTITSTYRLPQTCANNQATKWDTATRTWVCADDIDTNTTYSAGNGLELIGTQFNLDLVHSLPQGCNSGQTAKWDSATRTWGCANDIDTDTDTTYSAGTGLNIIGTQFNLALAYSLPQGCGPDQTAKWSGTVWACANDTDTTYSAGAGLTEAGNLFSIISTYRLPQTCTDNQTTKWDDDTNTWYCSNDNDTAYTAGEGLNLIGTQFSITPTYRLPQTCTAGQTTQWNNVSHTWVCADDNSGTTYIAGDGLDLTGSTFSVDVTDLIGTGLAEDASNNLTVDFGTGTNQAARGDHTHTIGGDLSGTLANLQIVANAVGSAEIADNAVGSTEIASDAVGSAEIASDAVGSAEIATDAVGSAEIIANGVDMADTVNWMSHSNPSATFIDNAAARNVDLWINQSFTPSADGSCLVVASAVIESSGSASTDPEPGVNLVVERDGIVTPDTSNVMSFTPEDINSRQVSTASANFVFAVYSGDVTRFGCRVSDPTGSDWGTDETVRCRISYICQ